MGQRYEITLIEDSQIKGNDYQITEMIVFFCFESTISGLYSIVVSHSRGIMPERTALQSPWKMTKTKETTVTLTLT